MGLTSIFVAPLGFSLQGRNAAHNASVHAQEMVSATAEKSRELAQNGKVKAAELSSKGKRTAVDLSAQVRGTASSISGTAAEKIKKPPQMGAEAVKKAPGIVSWASDGDANGPSSTPLSHNMDGNSDRGRSVTGEAPNSMSDLSSSTNEPTKQTGPGIDAGKQPVSNHVQNAVSSFPAQAGGGKRTDSVSETGFHYAPAAHDNLYLPRGAAQEETNGYT